MAKEIPYFKFYTGEWTDGDITLESYHLQGLFINICAYYWSKECDVSLVNTKKKFKGFETDVDSLLQSDCLKLIDDKISISFLNEQFSSKEIQKAVNRNNGALGGRPRIITEPKKTETKPNGLNFENQSDNRNITNIKEIREEDILSLDNMVGLSTSTTTKNIPFTERCDGFIKKFNELRSSKYQCTEKVKKALKVRLKNYSSAQITSALKMAIKDPKHVEENFKYLTPEFILREDILERYLNIKGDFIPKQQNNNFLIATGASTEPINHDHRA